MSTNQIKKKKSGFISIYTFLFTLIITAASVLYKRVIRWILNKLFFFVQGQHEFTSLYAMHCIFRSQWFTSHWDRPQILAGGTWLLPSLQSPQCTAHRKLPNILMADYQAVQSGSLASFRWLSQAVDKRSNRLSCIQGSCRLFGSRSLIATHCCASRFPPAASGSAHRYVHKHTDCDF